MFAAENPGTQDRVLIVVMPWAPPIFPALGPALLRSVLLRESIPCDIVYGNLIFSKLIDGDPFFEHQLDKMPMSELAFTPHYFDTSAEQAAEKLYEYARRSVADVTSHTRDRYLGLIEAAGRCV